MWSMQVRFSACYILEVQPNNKSKKVTFISIFANSWVVT